MSIQIVVASSKDNGIECSINEVDSSPWLCLPWSKRNNFCWSLISSGKQTFASYSLSHIATIALTSYGGPFVSQFVQPGFTLSGNLSAKQQYAVSAIITKSITHFKLKLETTYRYAASEGRVIRVEDLVKFNKPPILTANLTMATCNAFNLHLPLTLKSNFDNTHLKPIFHSNAILGKPAKSTLTTLRNLDILTPSGVQRWNDDGGKGFGI